MIVENAMDIDRLKTLKAFKLYAIPLKINADASPVRLFVEY
jgi:kynurenine formamidase